MHSNNLQLATCNGQLIVVIALCTFAWIPFCCLGRRSKAGQGKASRVELREEKKSQGDTKQKLAKLNLWPLFFANCKCKMKCLATRQTKRDQTRRGVARNGEASNRNCLLQIISQPDQLAWVLGIFYCLFLCANTFVFPLKSRQWQNPQWAACVAAAVATSTEWHAQ